MGLGVGALARGVGMDSRMKLLRMVESRNRKGSIYYIYGEKLRCSI
ncbi:hypothetical protein EMIT036CA2_110051 [Chryseobacterium sp. IT-36CA2]